MYSFCSFAVQSVGIYLINNKYLFLQDWTIVFILTFSKLLDFFLIKDSLTSLVNVVSPFLRSYGTRSMESNSTLLYLMVAHVQMLQGKNTFKPAQNLNL